MKIFEMDLELISQATTFLEGKIRHTPLEFSPILSDLLGNAVHLKLESLQITGSFKVRGALFFLSTLTESEKRRGVATCSAGNHGLGLAYAARQMGVDCIVYVPKNVDRSKEEKILRLGAKVIRSEVNGYDDTLFWAEEQAQKNGQYLVSAFDDERIMAGNGGTLAVEILKDLPSTQNILFPVGGGGLSAGLSFYAKAKNPSIRLVGSQHIDSPALKLSLEKGNAVTTLPGIDTIAGGIEGGIGKKCFEILKKRVDEVSLVTEAEICEGVRWMLKHHQYLIEPSAVVAVASCLSGKLTQMEGDTVIVLTGRNVAYPTLRALIEG